MNKWINYVYGILILSLICLIIGLFSSLSILESGRVVFGSVFVLFFVFNDISVLLDS